MARAMMKVQMEHALVRLSEAFDKILGKQPESSPTARQQGRAKLVKSGKVKITDAMVKRAISRHERSLSRNSRYCDDIEECLRSELRSELDKAYKPVTDPATAKWEARRTKLIVKYNECKDEIILGDVDRDLKLIAPFAKTNV